MLEATVFERCFRTWIGGLAGVVEGVIALDGKTVCGSRAGENTALHRVSAFATASGLCLGQKGTRGKGNEIAAIQALLDTLMLKGSIVTLDALGCQTEIAQKIVDRGATICWRSRIRRETWRMRSESSSTRPRRIRYFTGESVCECGERSWPDRDPP